MAGYWLVRGGEVRDPDALREYGKRWAEIAERYGAEVIAGKGAVETREGPHFSRQLVVRFASYQQAVECYDDPEYREAMAFAQRAYDRELSIVEG